MPVSLFCIPRVINKLNVFSFIDHTSEANEITVFVKYCETAHALLTGQIGKWTDCAVGMTDLAFVERHGSGVALRTLERESGFKSWLRC